MARVPKIMARTILSCSNIFNIFARPVSLCREGHVHIYDGPHIRPWSHNNITIIPYLLPLFYNCLQRSGSVVCIANGYVLNGPGIESRWGRDFPHLSRPALEPTQPPVQWVPGLSRGVKSGRGLTLTPQTLIVPWS